MIGPTSGASGVPQRDIEEGSMRVKRKALEDLDVGELCGEDTRTLQGTTGKKRYLDLQQSGLEVFATNPIGDNQIYTNVPPKQEDSSVTRLEVLVVDNWDAESFEDSDLTELTVTAADFDSHFPQGQILQIQDNNQNFQETNFWHQPETPWHVKQNPTVPVHNTKTSSHGSFRVPPAPPNLPPPVEDQENGNLSWLLDFKLDSFIGAPDEKPSIVGPKEHSNSERNKNRSTNRTNSCGSYFTESTKKFYVHSTTLRDTSLPSRTDEKPPMFRSSCNYSADTQNCLGGPKKPPFTYTELIEHALQERGELTVSAIYQWISEHFPYYKSNDDRWKNSVRHNLSINPHFRKGLKAPHGAGHLWAIANREELRPRPLINNIVQGLSSKQSPKAIADSILHPKNEMPKILNQAMLDEVAAATASISQPVEEEEEEEHIPSISLEHCAEQILNGVKKQVEVQYLVPMVVPNNGDFESVNDQCQQNGNAEHCSIKETAFLNPVSKEVVAEECGLLGEGYLVTDLNPSSLGLNIVDPDTLSPDLFGEELSFQFYEFTSPSQLQSA